MHLAEHHRHENFASLEAVHIDNLAPTLAGLHGVAVGCRLDKGPTQLGDVLNPPSRPGLFPIDESYGDAVSNNNVSRLQIVVNDTVEAIDQQSGEIVKLPHDP